MREIKAFGAFAVRFGLIFTVLVLPWPPLKNLIRDVFLTESELLLRLTLPYQPVEVQPYQDPEHSSIDSRVILGDPRNTPADRQAPVKVITLDGRSLAWIPHAVWFALCGSTPVSWPRRVKMLLVGFALVQIFVGVTVFSVVLGGLVQDSSPNWQTALLQVLNHLLVDNLWVSFVMPLLVWCIWMAYRGEWPSVPTARQVDR